MNAQNFLDPDSPHYFDLPLREQADLLRGLAPVLGRRAEILEKDIWLCQVLVALSTWPRRKPMVFESGMLLSKLYRVIGHFPDDLKIAIDARSLVADIPGLTMLPDLLKAALRHHVNQELVPALQVSLAQAMPTAGIRVKVSEDAGQVWLYYPSALAHPYAGAPAGIRMEFGGRHAASSCDTLSIAPAVAAHVPGLTFPMARVAVLSPQIQPGGRARRRKPHVAPNRGQSKAGPGSVLRPGAICSWPQAWTNG